MRERRCVWREKAMVTVNSSRLSPVTWLPDSRERERAGFAPGTAGAEAYITVESKIHGD